MQEFEKIIQQKETNKLLTYYNKHRHVLEKSNLNKKHQQLEKTPDNTKSGIQDVNTAKIELKKSSLQPI